MTRNGFQIVLAISLLLASCSGFNLQDHPDGITELEDVDTKNLYTPIWSSDGSQILIAYGSLGAPDIAGIFQQKGQFDHDIVIFDTNTWESSVILSEQAGEFFLQSWSSEDQQISFYWSSGPEGAGIYLLNQYYNQPSFISKNGSISPDFEKIAFVRGQNLIISTLQKGVSREILLPEVGEWELTSWSPDMEYLTLKYTKNSDNKFDTIYLFSLSNHNYRQITFDEEYFKRSPTISPNGKYIAYVTWQFLEKRIEDQIIISSLNQNCEWTIPISIIHEFSWSPDSMNMFVSTKDKAYLVDLEILLGETFSSNIACDN